MTRNEGEKNKIPMKRKPFYKLKLELLSEKKKLWPRHYFRGSNYYLIPILVKNDTCLLG